MFLPNIKNKAPANRLIFKFMIIKVKTNPKPIVKPGDLHEIIYSA